MGETVSADEPAPFAALFDALFELVRRSRCPDLFDPTTRSRMMFEYAIRDAEEVLKEYEFVPVDPATDAVVRAAVKWADSDQTSESADQLYVAIQKHLIRKAGAK